MSRWLVDRRVLDRVRRLEIPWNAHGIDPYGITQTALARMFTGLEWAYRRWFRVRVEGIEHVPARGRAMLIGNHSGGIGIDGMMTLASVFFEREPPRLAQGMAEKFLNELPFSSWITSRTGNFTGLPENAAHLLEEGRLLLVFPEGARGTAKLYRERNSLVRFGTGFLRLAIQTRTPIVPFAFVGGGDAVPTVANLYGLGRLFGVPYIPVTPWIAPLPLPVRLGIRYSEPMLFGGTGNEDDGVIAAHVEAVKGRIAALIARGKP